MNRRQRRQSIIGVLLILLGVGFAVLPKEWIEETFGFEPDGGNGFLELAFALVPIIIGVVLLARAVVASRRTELSSTDASGG